MDDSVFVRIWFIIAIIGAVLVTVLPWFGVQVG